jgi:hypothetical protein
VRRVLEGRTALRDPASVVAEVLDRDADTVLGPLVPGADREARRYLTTVTVEFGRGRQAAQEVEVDLVPLGDADRGTAWSLSWTPIGTSSLLPDLEGTLAVRPDGPGCVLVLEGSYHPPLGPVGAFGDGVIGHRVARRTVDRFMADMRERLVTALQERADAAPLRPPPTPPDLRPSPHEGGGEDGSGETPEAIDLRDATHSENWLG